MAESNPMIGGQENRARMGLKSYSMELLPYAAMVSLECLDVGLTTIGKAAISSGMSHFVFVFYSNALATLILFPTSLIFQRKNRPPISIPVLCKFFLLSLVGITGMQNFAFTGISYSSPTLGSAMSQLVPAFTFLLAVFFRMEKLDLGSSRSQIKILGTLVSISGALIVIFYKGPPVFAAIQQNHEPMTSSLIMMMETPNSWVIGGFFLATASLCLSIFSIFQAALVKEYPSEMTIVSFYSLFGTLQCGVVSFIAERGNADAWKLRPNVELIPVIYSAVIGSVYTYNVLTWCINKKGPVFVAMFKPLGIAIAAFLGIIFLGDTLHIGTIIGAIIIVGGFYGVVWALFKEEEQGRASKVDELLRPPTDKTPLLETHFKI